MRLFSVLSLLALGLNAVPASASKFEAALAACGVTNPNCKVSATSCDDYVGCEENLLNDIIEALKQAKRERNTGRASSCTIAKRAVEVIVQGNTTTLDCIDTDSGPKIGG